MEAYVTDVFIGSAEQEYDDRDHLSDEKKNPTEIEKIDFIQKNYGHILFEVEESNDSEDGKFYWLLVGFFVNGEEVKYVSNWLPNGTDREAMYVVEVPQKYLKIGKTISLQVKTAPGEVYWRRNVPRKYTEESGVFYLKLTDKQGAYS